MTTDTAAPVTTTARKPLTTRRFKIGMSVLLALGLVVLGAVLLKTNAYHDSFHSIAKEQVFIIQKALAYKQDLPTAANSVSGESASSNGTDYTTKASVLPGKNFTYRLTVNDGYVYDYDSRTGFFTGKCTTLGCWIGLRQSS